MWTDKNSAKLTEPGIFDGLRIHTNVLVKTLEVLDDGSVDAADVNTLSNYCIVDTRLTMW